jgi:hypothetical protein
VQSTGPVVSKRLTMLAARARVDHRVRLERDSAKPAAMNWIAAGVFGRVRDNAAHVYDRIIGLDLSEVSCEGALHKALREGRESGSPFAGSVPNPA